MIQRYDNTSRNHSKHFSAFDEKISDTEQDARLNNFVADPTRREYLVDKTAKYKADQEDLGSRMKNAKKEFKRAEAAGDMVAGSTQKYLGTNLGGVRHAAEKLMRAGDFGDGEAFDGPLAPDPPRHKGVIPPPEDNTKRVEIGSGRSEEFIKCFKGNQRVACSGGLEDGGSSSTMCQENRGVEESAVVAGGIMSKMLSDMHDNKNNNIEDEKLLVEVSDDEGEKVKKNFQEQESKTTENISSPDYNKKLIIESSLTADVAAKADDVKHSPESCASDSTKNLSNASASPDTDASHKDSSEKAISDKDMNETSPSCKFSEKDMENEDNDIHATNNALVDLPGQSPLEENTSIEKAALDFEQKVAEAFAGFENSSSSTAVVEKEAEKADDKEAAGDEEEDFDAEFTAPVAVEESDNNTAEDKNVNSTEGTSSSSTSVPEAPKDSSNLEENSSDNDDSENVVDANALHELIKAYNEEKAKSESEASKSEEENENQDSKNESEEKTEALQKSVQSVPEIQNSSSTDKPNSTGENIPDLNPENTGEENTSTTSAAPAAGISMKRPAGVSIATKNSVGVSIQKRGGITIKRQTTESAPAEEPVKKVGIKMGVKKQTPTTTVEKTEQPAVVPACSSGACGSGKKPNTGETGTIGGGCGSGA